jgi:serine protease AprX
VEAAWRAGIVVVVAAGNDGRNNHVGNQGYGTIEAPANDPYVITVGAMKTMGTMDRSDDLITTYSSKGPSVLDQVVKPDIVAPGNGVVSLLSPNSTLASSYPTDAIALSYYEQTPAHRPSPYFSLSGTSMATPVVSGAVADLVEAQPTLTPDQVKARLMQTANKSFPASSSYTDPPPARRTPASTTSSLSAPVTLTSGPPWRARM